MRKKWEGRPVSNLQTPVLRNEFAVSDSIYLIF